MFAKVEAVFLFLLGAAIFGSGCASVVSQMTFQFRNGPSSSKAKFFLIAGSAENANFAQEVIDQRKIWLAVGYKPEEINCYYVAPWPERLADDWDQYAALHSELKNCYRAEVKTIRAHLLKSAKNNHSFVYVYASSHGAPPYLVFAKYYRDQNEKDYADDLSELRDRYPTVLDQFSLSVDSVDGKTAGLRTLLENPASPQDVFFTPRYLKASLQSFPARTKKFVVLQGCFSGGFIRDTRPGFESDVISTLPNLLALTAASSDRTSFGCQSWGDRTAFGELVGINLVEQAKAPPKLDWVKIYRNLKAGIRKQEDEMKLPEPSEPQYFSNVTGGNTTMLAE